MQMFKQLGDLFRVMTETQKKRFMRLQILVIAMAFGEVVGITSIGPFMALVANISLIESNPTFFKVYQFTGFDSPYKFLFAIGLIVLVLLSVASLVSMLTTWRLSLFSFSVGTEISNRLYNYYLQKDWLFHSGESSAHLVKQVSTESFRVTAQVILPLMQMNARIVLALFISVGMLLYNPAAALVSVSLFFAAYVILFRIVRITLNKNGRQISAMSRERFKLMSEGFGGIKDILLLDRGEYFTQSFEERGELLARAHGTNYALAYAPRYLMEMLAFGIMVCLILFLIVKDRGNLSEVLPLLAIYGLAGFKLLPALQNVYSSVSEIRGNIAAFEAIKTDLQDSMKVTPKPKFSDRIVPNEGIQFKDVSFRYPGKENLALTHLSMEMPAKKLIGLVGPSGAGKSTVIDILLGLVQPSSGVVAVDDVVIQGDFLRRWQNSIGFVPQSIFLCDGSIAQNIAFGLPEDQINYKQVEKVLKMARLDDFVSQQPTGLKTNVGERGVQLSGGQRQRIGIARALYNDASVLVFDEATSALDGVTERLIMDAIHELAEEKTVIMIAHRLKTVEKCDLIFYMEGGQVRSQGTYMQLLEKDPKFRELAKHA